MRPDERDLDEEIRGHLALGIHDRIERGEDPAAARRAALAELGGVMSTRESMRGVWRNRWIDSLDAFVQDLRIALGSLRRARGLAATVVVTLALGIGANAAMFSVVRDVLHRPLVNRDEDRLVYIRQSAPGLGADNTTFSVPEIDDLRSRVTTISAFGDFSTIEFTMIGFGEPRVVRAGVVGGSYFDVIHPFRQMPFGGRVFVHAAGDPYALVPSVTQVIQRMSADQPVERAATLADVRAQVLAPERLNALVFSGFAGVALLIAVVGVAGVLSFSVSARTHELGVRLAIGSTPRRLLLQVLSQGALIAMLGIAAGAAGGYLFGGVAASYVENVRLPGAVPTLAAGALLICAAIAASLMPAARASRVDVIQALRSE